jgi:hypothetical protein
MSPKICKKCGAECEGDWCPNCGTAHHSGCRTAAAVAIFVLFILPLGLVASCTFSYALAPGGAQPVFALATALLCLAVFGCVLLIWGLLRGKKP